MNDKNFDSVSSLWLEQIGVSSVEELKKRDAIEVFIEIEDLGFAPPLSFLWLLHSVINDEEIKKMNLAIRKNLMINLEKAREKKKLQLLAS